MLRKIHACKIRNQWSSESKKLYFSVVYIIEAIANNDNSRSYWNDLKLKPINERANEIYYKIVHLKIR